MPTTRLSLAEHYHAQTKYSPEGLARKRFQPDAERQPSPFKEYLAGDPVSLAETLPLGETADWRSPWGNLPALSRLLYLTNGVTAVVPYPERPFLMRAAPSAGGLYPTEIYLAVRGFPDLEDGLYDYQVRGHGLLGFWRGDVFPRLAEACFDHPALRIGARSPGDTSQAAIVLTGVFERSAWRYQDRAYRRICLDTGHVLGNLTLAAPLVGRRAVPIGGFCDARLNDLLFLDPDEEGALAVVALLPIDAPEAEEVAPLASARVEAWNVPEGERLLALHSSSAIGPVPEPPVEVEEAERRPPLGFAEALEGEPVSWRDPDDGRSILPTTILHRRSARNYSGGPITREELATLLEAAYAPACGFAPALLQTYLAVNRVRGLEAGCYHYDPAEGRIRQIRFKNLSREVEFLCLGQKLGGDASAVVFHTAHLPSAIARYGERAYRYLHLDAGLIGQRLNLAAVRLSLGASGIGGFFDDHVNDLLGIPPEEAVVYITTLGHPEEE